MGGAIRLTINSYVVGGERGDADRAHPRNNKRRLARVLLTAEEERSPKTHRDTRCCLAALY